MLGSRVRSPGGSRKRLQNTFWSLFCLHILDTPPSFSGNLLRIHKNAPIRGQIPPAGTIHPHQAPSVWTDGNYFSSASTKTPLFVDKCHLRAPYIHTRHPLYGQTATISPPRPQKRPHPWTNTTCGHHTSTPGTLCVDRRQLFLLRIHKNAPIRGQMPPAGTIHPHQAPSVWTDGNYFSSASTETPPSVDKYHLRAPYIHTRHPLCGQAATPGTFRPQKIPYLWTKPYSYLCRIYNNSIFL